MNKTKIAKLNKGVNMKKSRKSGVFTAGKIILLSFLTLLFLLFVGIYVFLNIYQPEIDNISSFDKPSFWGPWDESEGEGEVSDTTEMADRKVAYNILVVGSDDIGGLTDTIMLISFNVEDSVISIMNIPRDTYVSTKQYSGKINSVFPRGYNIGRRDGLEREQANEKGMKDLAAMIKFTLGVPVDKFVMVNTEGFRFLVDKVGGIDIEVPIRMKYTDPYQNLYIDLQPGWQHLDGEKAEQFVRFRQGDPGYPDYLEGDLGRVKTQQKFMATVAKKLLSDFSFRNMSALFEVSDKYMTTNISAGNAGWFALKALDVKLEDMRVHTLPGTWLGAPVNHYEIFRQEAIEIINKYYNPLLEDIPESSFNISDKNVNNSTYRPEINIDGTTLDSMLQ